MGLGGWGSLLLMFGPARVELLNDFETSERDHQRARRRRFLSSLPNILSAMEPAVPPADTRHAGTQVGVVDLADPDTTPAIEFYEIDAGAGMDWKTPAKVTSGVSYPVDTDAIPFDTDRSLGVRERNQWGLVSLETGTRRFITGPAGEALPIPSGGPATYFARTGISGELRVVARYPYYPDQDDAADTWRVFVAEAPERVDLDVDTPRVVVAMEKRGETGVAVLDVQIIELFPDTLYSVLVQTTIGTTDSQNNEQKTATVIAVSPAPPAIHG